MKKDIHPEYVDCTVTCTCGNTFQTRSTKPEIRVDICNACHPFFTGQQKLIDSGGRVQRFANKFGAATEAVAAREAAKKAERAAAVEAAEAAKKAEREAKAAAKAARAAEFAKKAEEEAAKAAAEAEAEPAAEEEVPAEAAEEAVVAEFAEETVVECFHCVVLPNNPRLVKRNDAARGPDGTGKLQRARHGAKANALPFSVPLYSSGPRSLFRSTMEFGKRRSHRASAFLLLR